MKIDEPDPVLDEYMDEENDFDDQDLWQSLRKQEAAYSKYLQNKMK